MSVNWVVPQDSLRLLSLAEVSSAPCTASAKFLFILTEVSSAAFSFGGVRLGEAFSEDDGGGGGGGADGIGLELGVGEAI